jgi:hypothetical protein
MRCCPKIFLPAFLKIQDMAPKTRRASAEPKTYNSRGQTAKEQAAEMLQYEEDANQDGDPNANQDVDPEDVIQDVNIEDINDDDLSMEDLLRLAQEAGAAARLASEREQLLQDGLKILHSQKDKMSIYCIEITTLNLTQDEIRTLLRRYRLQPQKVSLPGPSATKENRVFNKGIIIPEYFREDVRVSIPFYLSTDLSFA